MLSGFDIDDFTETAAGESSLVYDDTDLVVIVMPMEGTALCPTNQTVSQNQSTLAAFASNCQNDQSDRPTVGYASICFGPLELADNTTKAYQRQFSTLSHELTHVLGMNSYDIAFYYDHATGEPRTPRNQLLKESLCVDGTRRTVPTPSEDTLKPITTANGALACECGECFIC